MGCEDGNKKTRAALSFLLSSSSSCRYTCPLAGCKHTFTSGSFCRLVVVGKNNNAAALSSVFALFLARSFTTNKDPVVWPRQACIHPSSRLWGKTQQEPRGGCSSSILHVLKLLHRHPEAHAHIVIIGERASPSSIFFSRPSFSWGKTEEKPRGLAVLSPSFSFYFFFLLRRVFEKPGRRQGGFLDQINHTRPAAPLHNNKPEDKEGGNHTRAHQERNPSELFSSYS